ncbi:MAG: response regulator [Magnetococcales bacterium]|nr:response regulator [Magnetococcales bacterium]
MTWLESLSFKSKLAILFFLIAILPLLATGWLTVEQADRVLMDKAKEALSTALLFKKMQVEQYFDMTGKQLRELSLRSGLKEWLTQIKHSFHETAVPSETAVFRDRLKARFDLSFVPEYRKRQGNRVPPDAYITLLDNRALFWQERLFVHSNSALKVTGNETGDGAELFIRLHYLYDDMMRQQIDNYDYYDLFMVDDQTGHIVYAVRNEIDFATSLESGPFAQTGLGTAYRSVLARDEADDTPVMVDFSPYFPSFDEPSAFMAVPVIDAGKRIGLLATQIHFRAIDKILNDERGRSKGVRIVFLDRHGIEMTDGEPVVSGDGQSGLFPKTGAATSESFQNRGLHDLEKALWTRINLDLPGFSSSLVGVSSLTEVMAPVEVMDRSLAITFVMSLLAVTVLAVGSGGLLLSPLRRLSATAGKIAKGEWSARVGVTSDDELGTVGRAFNSMAQRVEEEYWIKEHLARLSRIFQSVKGVEAFTRTVLRELMELFAATQGAFFLLDRRKGRYVSVAAYRTQPWHDESLSFALGEGIVGRCALERRVLVFEGSPEPVWSVATGLGTSPPVALLALPMNYQDHAQGVVIMVSTHPFSPIQRQLLEEIALLGGLTLDNLERVQHVEELLEEMRRQTVELEMGQQELEQMNLELERTSQDLRLSEELLRNQNDELEANNRALEAQSQLLAGRNEQLAQAHADLEQTSRYKSEFLASMSHELRTPLNSILILAREFMRNTEGHLVAEQVEDAEVIHQSGSELLEMINEILDLSRIESGQMEHRLEETVFASFATEMRRQFAPLAKEKGLMWQVDVDETMTEPLWIDQEKIRRIVKNLVANAFKFTREGRIALHMGLEPAAENTVPHLVISVADTGCGIPPEEQERIFDAFRQIKSNDGGKQGGVGLGLAIARKLAGLIHGEIQLASTPGQGSTFTLRVPCAPVSEIAGGDPVAAPPAPDASEGIPDLWLTEFSRGSPQGEVSSGNTRRLLIIEDDPVFARSVRQLAEGRKFEVVVGATGREGLALAVQIRPGGILLDLGLPDMPGEEVMARLRADVRTRHIPVHVVSGKEDPGMAARPGSLGFLAKPVPDADLLEVLYRMMPTSTDRLHRLLLVEDHVAMRRSIIDLIRDVPVTVVEAENGAQALELFAAGSFDCMVLDLGLPDIDGAQLLERMRAMGTLPPVIIHSARELTRAQYELLQGYTDSIVVKGPHLEARLREEIILFLHRVIRDTPEVLHGDSSNPLPHRDDLLVGKNVLLVDDDVRNVFSMTRSLEKRGLQVRMAGNGAEAITLLQQGPAVDIVLMDIMMPVMDGYEAIRRIRARDSCRRIPVLALTAKAMHEDRQKCLEAGANDYLSKPVDMDRLFEMMRIWLENVNIQE